MRVWCWGIGGGGGGYDAVILTGAFLSLGFIMNFLSLNEMFLISLHGKPILGVNLQTTEL